MKDKQDGVLTFEMIEEAAEREAKRGYVHPCLQGHTPIPCAHPIFNAVCSFCGEMFKLDKKKQTSDNKKI